VIEFLPSACDIESAGGWANCPANAGGLAVRAIRPVGRTWPPCSPLWRGRSQPRVTMPTNRPGFGRPRPTRSGLGYSRRLWGVVAVAFRHSRPRIVLPAAS